MDRSLDSSSLTSLETMPSPDVKDQMPSVQMRSATSNQNLPREISKVVTSNYPSSSLSESSVTLSTGMKMSQYPGGLSWSHDVWWVWCIFLAEFSVFHHFNFKSSIAILPTYEKEGSYPSKNRNGNYWSLNSLSLKCTFFQMVKVSTLSSLVMHDHFWEKCPAFHSPPALSQQCWRCACGAKEVVAFIQLSIIFHESDYVITMSSGMNVIPPFATVDRRFIQIQEELSRPFS